MFLSVQMKRELDDRVRRDLSPEFAERIIRDNNAIKLYEIKRCIHPVLNGSVNISNVEWIHVAFTPYFQFACFQEISKITKKLQETIWNLLSIQLYLQI